MSEPDRIAAVIVLAAGEGTRMKSPAAPKVLHGFAGRSLLGHTLAATAALHAGVTVVVIGHRAEEVRAHVAAISPDAVCVVQERQRGTGDAVVAALGSVPDGTVLVVPGDTPLLTAQSLRALLAAHREATAAATVLTSQVADPTGYGRVLRSPAGPVTGIVEHKDASAAERAIDEIAAGVYLFERHALADALARVGTDNAQGEYYLPDVIGLLAADGRRVIAVQAPAAETAGVNDRVQLADAARVYNDRVLRAHMLAGVTVVDPGSTWVDATVELGLDVTVHPGVQLRGTSRVGDGAEIGPRVTLTDTSIGPRTRVLDAVAVSATVGADVTIGPFAYLRPGTVLADGVHIGTYVELKGSEVGEGTKIPHLSYVGDATIGAHTNIGAATVFVNYDGVHKHRSQIGDHARTGADNMFVAPVRVGDGAYTAAGSIITSDVPPGALGIARARQSNLEGWVQRNRAGTPAADAASKATAITGTDPSDDDEPSEDRR